MKFHGHSYHAYPISARFKNLISLGVEGTMKNDINPTNTVNVPSCEMNNENLITMEYE